MDAVIALLGLFLIGKLHIHTVDLEPMTLLSITLLREEEVTWGRAHWPIAGILLYWLLMVNGYFI